MEMPFQDPMNPNETIIVIRSLVPGGVAQQDGRLIPGDRLLSVNEIHLENATLDAAVQALKGAARGVVRIGVAKPLPLPESQVSEAGGSFSGSLRHHIGPTRLIPGLGKTLPPFKSESM